MAKRKPVTVYNASKTNVLARVTSDYQSETALGVGVGPITVRNTAKYEKPVKHGFSMVEKWSKVAFFPEKNKKTAYVSIKPTGDAKSEYMYLCEDHPVEDDDSGVIITKNFYLRIAKSAWTDTDGESHEPKNEKKEHRELSGIKYLVKHNSKQVNTLSDTVEENTEIANADGNENIS